MNWVKIEKSYPKAYTMFYKWMIPEVYSERDLYDFFDENGIYINIEPDFLEGNFVQWDFYVYYNHDSQSNADYYNSRKEAESAAFEKAFEILEEKLNEKII